MKTATTDSSHPNIILPPPPISHTHTKKGYKQLTRNKQPRPQPMQHDACECANMEGAAKLIFPPRHLERGGGEAEIEMQKHRVDK